MSAPTTKPPLSLGELFRGERRALAWGAATVLISASLKMALPWLVRGSVNALASERSDAVTTAISFAVAMVAFAVVGNVIRVVSRVLLFDTSRRVERDVRLRIYRHLQTLSPEDLRGHPVGEIISRTTNDLTNVRVLVGPAFLNIVNTLGSYLFVLPLLIAIDPGLALLALLPNPVLFVAMALFARGIMRQSREVQARLGHLSRGVAQDLASVSIVRLFGCVPWRSKLFAETSRGYRDAHLRLARTRATMAPVIGSLAGVGMLIVLWVGGRKVISGDVTLGDFFAFSLYLGMLIWPTMAMGWVLSGWQRGRASLERLVDLLALTPSVPGGDARLPRPARGVLDLRGLSVRRSGHTLLEGVELSVDSGEVVAIVGRTGAGKSTLLRAIAGLVAPSAGLIYIDGVDASTLCRAELRAHVAVVPQETWLFATTLRENIAFGAPRGGRSPDDRALDEAIRVAVLDEAVARLPDGVDTVLGERGLTLSGGQRQRVAIARAFVRQPAILLLDDCLSSLDVDTEREVLQRLPSALRGRTTLIVSHRLSAVQWAHRIVVLDRGQVVEEGDHDSLLARGGVYAALFEEQARQERLARALSGERDALEEGV